MPNLDGRGPRGLGPMTGRGLGYCGGPGRGFRRGFGRGYGRGFGRARGFFDYPAAEPVPVSKQDEKTALAQELKDIEAEKREIEKRLKELK